MKRFVMLSLVMIGFHACFSQSLVSSSSETPLVEMETTEESSVMESSLAMTDFVHSYSPYSVPQNDYYYSNSSGQRMSDGLLMKNYITEKAIKIRKTGIIGGGILGGCGLLTTIIACSFIPQTVNFGYILIPLVPGLALLGGGITWTCVAYHRAKQMLESVKYISMFEHEVFSNEHNGLTARFDYVKSQVSGSSNGLGISLTYYF